MVYIDVQKTLIQNATLSDAECLSALKVLLRCLPERVRLVSSMAGGGLCGLPIGDKPEALRALRPGDIMVDDEEVFLKIALRRGAIAVPASALAALANWFCLYERR